MKILLAKAKMSGSEKRAVLDVMNSGWLTHGDRNREFETNFANYIGVKHALTLNSCTSALFLALVANNIKGEVILPSFTFVASANAVVTAGATPVFADIEYDTCNIDPSDIEKKITRRTEALMVVHYAGQCCDMDRIDRIVKKHKLLLIEDSAQTIGGEYKGIRSGNWGTGCFSFFPTKNITTGEGGMLTTNNLKIYEKVKMLSAHGIPKRSKKNTWYRSALIYGYNFRMSNILAAIGVEQLKRIDWLNAKRREFSKYLIKKLSGIENLELPVERKDNLHVYQMFNVKIKNPGKRDGFVRYLEDKKIEASVHFDPPVHRQPPYKKYAKTKLPITDEVSTRIATLPMHPFLTYKELDFMVNVIKKGIDCV